MSITYEADSYIRTLKLGNELLVEHGLNDWQFDISSEKQTLGRCFQGKRKIVFSVYYLHIPESEIRDTILHEIAHALVGAGHNHDDVWKAKAVEIGARPERLAPPENQTAAKHNYYMECPSCKRRWYRFRMRRRNHGSRCPDCHVTVQIFRIVR